MKTQDTVMIRPVSVIESLISFGDDDSASFKAGANVNADELISYGESRLAEVGSKTIRLVNVIRLAKQLPRVSVPMLGDDGKPKLNGDKPMLKQVDAFAYVCEKVAKSCATASTWQNIKGLIECADIRDKKNLSASPFAIKEAMGYLKKAGVLSTTEDGETKLIGTDPVVKALKAGTGVNAMRPVIDKAKKVANKKAEDGGREVPFPVKGNTSTPAIKPVVELKPETVASDINHARMVASELNAKGKAAEVKAEILKAKEALVSLCRFAGLEVK